MFTVFLQFASLSKYKLNQILNWLLQNNYKKNISIWYNGLT